MSSARWHNVGLKGLLVLLSVVYTLLPGCDKCGPFKDMKIQYSGVELTPLNIHEFVKDSIRWTDSHSILLRLKNEAWVNLEKNRRFGYSGALMACDPAFNYTVRSAADSLQLFATENAGSSIVAGADITHLFEARYNHVSTYQSLPYFLGYEVINQTANPETDILIRLRSRILSTTDLKVVARLKTKDRQTFTSDTLCILF